MGGSSRIYGGIIGLIVRQMSSASKNKVNIGMNNSHPIYNSDMAEDKVAKTNIQINTNMKKSLT